MLNQEMSEPTRSDLESWSSAASERAVRVKNNVLLEEKIRGLRLSGPSGDDFMMAFELQQTTPHRDDMFGRSCVQLYGGLGHPRSAILESRASWCHHPASSPR